MIPIIYKSYIGEFVEVCVTYGGNGRKFWYHGKLLDSDISGVKIDDIKLGEMVLNSHNILYIKRMTQDEISRIKAKKQ